MVSFRRVTFVPEFLGPASALVTGRTVNDPRPVYEMWHAQ